MRCRPSEPGPGFAPGGRRRRVRVAPELAAGPVKVRTGNAFGQRVELVSGDPGRWEACERELLEAEASVPLSHRSCWIREMTTGRHWYVESRDERDGSLSAAFPIRRSPVRSLPGHCRLRWTRFGYAAREVGLLAALDVLPGVPESRPRVLSQSVEIFTVDSARRSVLENAAQRRGFTRAARGRRYRYTARVDLRPDEGDIASSFSGTCRRFIRDPAKKSYRVRPLREERWADRMEEIWEETFARTGVRPPPRRWPEHLAFARRHPDLYRIMGTFAPSYPERESLVSFACGRYNVDHASYADGASTRDVEPGVALTYAPMWELMKWAKEQGCAWFDMGGITEGSREDDDVRGGISDFKRRFTEDVVEVGTEWVVEADSLRSTVASAVSASASGVRAVLRRLRR